MNSALNRISENLCFGGKVGFYRYFSTTCYSEMGFSLYQPPQAESHRVPVLYYLSGLTCTEENFTIKAGVQRLAAKYGLMVVAPDTSPRNTGTPGEDNDWDLGTGAGFYVDATVEPWSRHYQMYSYVVEELPQLIATQFPAIPNQIGIFSHSMGDMGRLSVLYATLNNIYRFLRLLPLWPRCVVLGVKKHFWLI